MTHYTPRRCSPCHAGLTQLDTRVSTCSADDDAVRGAAPWGEAETPLAEGLGEAIGLLRCCSGGCWCCSAAAAVLLPLPFTCCITGDRPRPTAAEATDTFVCGTRRPTAA